MNWSFRRRASYYRSTSLACDIRNLASAHSAVPSDEVVERTQYLGYIGSTLSPPPALSVFTLNVGGLRPEELEEQEIADKLRVLKEAGVHVIFLQEVKSPWNKKLGDEDADDTKGYSWFVHDMRK